YGFHATVLGIRFDAVNVVFSGMGLLAVAGGIYTRIHLRSAMGMGQSPTGKSRDAAVSHAADVG
ncbi:MAG: hypothetical protein ACXVCO_18585, partial [Ktedonobacterales bacterium]